MSTDFRVTRKYVGATICFVGIVAMLFFCSWKKSANLNINTWSIYIGKKEILASSKHQRGDTAYLNLKKLNLDDSLFVSEFICGGTIKPPTIKLRVLQDDRPVFYLELLYTIRGTAFVSLNALLELSDFDKLRVEIYSSFNRYYPDLDKDDPMGILIIS